jgi:hypothetical protein
MPYVKYVVYVYNTCINWGQHWVNRSSVVPNGEKKVLATIVSIAYSVFQFDYYYVTWEKGPSIVCSETVYLTLVIEIHIVHSLRSCKMKLLSLVWDKQSQNILC